MLFLIYLVFKLKPTEFISSCWLGQPSGDLDQSANSGFRAVHLQFIQFIYTNTNIQLQTQKYATSI